MADKKIKEELTKDNLMGFFLFDELHRKSYLQELTINQLKDLVETSKRIVKNTNHLFRKSQVMFYILDRDNIYQRGSMLRDVIAYNCLKPKELIGGSQEDTYNKIKNRWEGE